VKRFTVFGTVYALLKRDQAPDEEGAVGVASYHFDAADDCYVSYAAAPREWALADGRLSPGRVCH
jgi:hypothetical protein